MGTAQSHWLWSHVVNEAKKQLSLELIQLGMFKVPKYH